MDVSHDRRSSRDRTMSNYDNDNGDCGDSGGDDSDTDSDRQRRRLSAEAEGRGSGADMVAFNIINERASNNKY